MKKAITLFFAFAFLGGMAIAQSTPVQLNPGDASSNSGNPALNNQVETRIATEVQNLDARINMNPTQEAAVTGVFQSAVSDIITMKNRLKGDREAYMTYREQRIDQAVDELEQHLTPSQFQGAKAYAQQRGFNF